MLHLFTGLNFDTSLMLILALLFVLFYEAINGFHDTANAVATIIYTRAMRSQLALIMAGLFNFLGVMLGGLSVAYAIVHFLPTDLLLNVSSKQGLAMVFSILLAAIIWNLSTWYFGLPASSSHTLIGAITGVSLTNALMTYTSIVDALNIPKMVGIFLSLFISPLIGMLGAGLIVFALRRFWCTTKKRERIHMTPSEREKVDGKRKPPFWTRIALILSAIGVSFSHGANDGQKGIGLLMLILIGIAPAGFVVNMNATDYDITRTRDAVFHLQQYYQQHSDARQQEVFLTPDLLHRDADAILNQHLQFHCDISRAMATIELTVGQLHNLNSYTQLTVEQRGQVRRLLMCITDTVNNIANLPGTTAADERFLKSLRQDLLKTVEYAPMWIIVAVALALSLGTMVGWERVATTIGEKIGKKGMTYAQGVSAQMTAALTIGIASYTGMPVSTTHVLSSALAGTMVVDGSGVQNKTLKHILLAWLLTLPISILLSGFLYWITLKYV
ncbi:Low-affinity inorganic phosphate transporter 1 [Serratia symbiotica]|nr:Low-affinity inorganic phosphate transporter 1 [Serratia symbiotica]